MPGIRKIAAKKLFFFIFILFDSCITDKQQLEFKMGALPEARRHVEHIAYLLDILRYGEFAKNKMSMEYLKDMEANNPYGYVPDVVFWIDQEKQNIPLYSEELRNYLPENEIDTLVYLTGWNKAEQNDLKYRLGNIYSDEIGAIFTYIIIDNIPVYITTNPEIEIRIFNQRRNNISYSEQVKNYYIHITIAPSMLNVHR
jgi:hypothetical protein